MEIALCTDSANDIVRYIKDKHVDGLYFLDIELNSKHNGVEVASTIRTFDPRGYIVFVTAHPRYAPMMDALFFKRMIG